MAETIKEIVLDVSKPKALKAIVAKQNDVNSRFLKATLTNSGQVIPISSSSTIALNVERPDGEVKAFVGTLNEDGTVTVPLTKWTLEQDGVARCEISVIDTNSKLTTLNFAISIEENLYSSEDFIEDDNYDLLVVMINRSTQATNACNEATENCIEKTSLADTATTEAVNAALSANQATDNANGAADKANQAADNANSAVENIRSLLKAGNIEYDPSKSGYNVENVQDALDVIIARMDWGDLRPKSWGEVSKIVQSGFAPKVFKIGEQLVCNHKDFGELVWDIIGFDCEHFRDEYADDEHSMTLALHSIPTKLQFDSPEAYFYTENGFPAGSYYFELGTFGEFYVTFTQDVPAKGQIGFKWNGTATPQNIKMDVYANCYAKEITESLSIIKGRTGEPLASYGVFNMPGYHLMYGSNTFSKSALFQYLNSNANNVKFWKPATEFDRCPSWYGTVKPFITGLDKDFYYCIYPVIKKVALNTVAEQGGTEEIEVEFFLPSRDEVGFGSEFADDPEGTPYPYFNSAVARKKFFNGSEYIWWLRTPRSSNAYSVNLVGYNNICGNYNANESIGVVPACVIA